MLVLARKLNEKIFLMDEAGRIIAEITVTDLHGTVVRLGFVARSEIKILREKRFPESDETGEKRA